MLKDNVILKDKKSRLFLALFITMLFFLSLPALNPVVYWAHDLSFHINRIERIAQGLAAGRFPIRNFPADHNGYGYGSPMFYPDIFLYIPAILNLLGLPLLYCYNLFVIGMNAATLLIGYYSYKEITGSKTVGLISSGIYSFCVYRFINVYNRAAVGESLAMLFAPLVLAGLIFIMRGETKRWYVLVLGAWGIFQSHILSLIIVAGFSLLFILVNIKSFLNKDKIVALIKAGAVIILLNLWFIIPMLEGMKLDLSVNHPDALKSIWRTKFYPAAIFDVLQQNVYADDNFERGPYHKTTQTVGIMLLLGTLLFVFSRLSGKKKENSKGLYVLLGFELLGLWMTSILFPWAIIAKIPSINAFFEKFQYLCRFNIVPMMFGSPVAAMGFYEFFVEHADDSEAKSKRTVLVILSFCVYSLVFIGRFVYTVPAQSNEDITGVGYADWLYLLNENTIFERPDFESDCDKLTCTNKVKNYDVLTFDYSAPEGEDVGYIDVPLAYYPGYAAAVNGKGADISCSPGGVVRVLTDNFGESGSVTVRFTEKPLWVAGDIISLVALFGFASLGVFNFIKRKKKSA